MNIYIFRIHLHVNNIPLYYKYMHNNKYINKNVIMFRSIYKEAENI